MEALPRPSAPAPRTKRSRPPEVPLVGGRIWWAAIPLVGIATLANGPLNGWVNDLTADRFDREEVARWKPGVSLDIRLTLVTADADRLACASDATFDGAHCEYRADKTRFPKPEAAPLDDNNLQIIQPYRTVIGNELVLVSGVWAQPEVAMRRHVEPASSTRVEKLQRFEARCRVTFVGEIPDALLRWEADQRWGKPTAAKVARVDLCEVGGRILKR